MATGLRSWQLALCITLLYVRITRSKIVEGTLNTKQVVNSDKYALGLWNTTKSNFRMTRSSIFHEVSLIAP